MTAILISFFLLAGSSFALFAGIGVVRMPDLYCRMHAATKAGSFGVALLLVGLALEVPSMRTILEGCAIVFFFFLTAPIGALMIARAALLWKTPAWKTPNPESPLSSEDQDS